MKFLIFFFLGSLLFGTVAGVTISPGITMYAHDGVLLLLIIAATVSVISKKKFRKPTLFSPIAGFTIAGILSLVVNAGLIPVSDVAKSSLYLLRWVGYVVVYLTTLQTFLPTLDWLWGLVFVGWGFALLGFLQYILYPSLRNLSYLGWDPHYFRLFSTLLDPNFTGIILVLTIFLGFFLWKKTKKNWVVVPTIFSIIALYLTYSRSSYLAFIAGSIYVIFSSAKRKTKGIISILLFLVLIIMLPKPGGDTLRLDRMVSTVARVENWQQSMQRFAKSPIVGFGFSTLRFVFPSNNGSVDLLSRAAAGVDNSFLFILLTTGLIGFTAFMWLLYMQFSFGNPLLVVSLLVVLVHAMFVNSLFYPWVMIWLWVISGVCERDPSLITRDDIKT